MRDRTCMRSSRSSAPEAETAVDDETATIGGHHPRRSLQLDCEPGPGDESCPVLLMIGNRFYCYYYSDTPNAMVTGELDKIMSVSCPNCNGRIEACRRTDGHISTLVNGPGCPLKIFWNDEGLEGTKGHFSN